MRWLVFAGSVVVGAVFVLVVAARPPSLFTAGRHARTNFRGATVAGTLGIVLAGPLVAGCAIAAAAGARGRVVAAVAVAGLAGGVVGLVDDVYGDRHAGGLVGHARALLRGRVTTGTLKAVTGALTGLAVAWILGWRGAWWVLAGAVVALASNFSNLLDVRPGRAIKVWLAGFVLLAVIARLGDGVLATAALAGGTLSFLRADLGERAMLGDGGAAVIGASLGAAAVASAGRPGLIASAAVLAVLTAVSEAVSFTQVIDRVPPLRFLDALGRKT
jgi:UDP-GlcNAc:undecaprenyl-phosphate GlcNAc-1-phosphate transferase